MNAKEYLQQLKKLDIMINQKISEKNELQRKAQSVRAVDYSKERVQTSHSDEASFAKQTDRIVDLEAEINAEIDAFIDQKHTVIGQIQQLNDVRHVDLLFKRYAQFKNFDCIAVEMNFTYQYIIELHRSALQNFQTTYENLLNPM